MSNTDSSNIKQKIQAALTLLKKEKHLDKIKVSEVTLLAGIGRSTFYRYYHDVYAVFEEMVDEFAERCIEIMKFFLFNSSCEEKITEAVDFSALLSLLGLCESDTAVVEHYLAEENADIFNRICDRFRIAVTKYAKTYGADVDSVDYYTKFIIGSLFFGYLLDFQKGRTFEPEFINLLRLLDLFNPDGMR